MSTPIYAIGIDLGTTNSVVAVWKDGAAQVLRSFEVGSAIIPSFVAYTDMGRLVGSAAYQQWEYNTKNTLYSTKRIIGRTSDDPVVRTEMKRVAYHVVPYNDGCGILLHAEDGTQTMVTPEAAAAAILSHLKSIAEENLKIPIKHAVITVPAYFNNTQREATRAAARIAELEVLSILNEPTAAALAYGLCSSSKGKNLCVVDLGGGTFDVTVMTISSTECRVRSTGGNSHLGGDDFDYKLFEYFTLQHSAARHTSDLSHIDKQRLLKASRAIKETLSDVHEEEYELRDFGPTHTDFLLQMSRAKFENLVAEYLHMIVHIIGQVVTDAKLTPKDIDDVVLVGGSCKIPKVQQVIQDFFNKVPHRNINPDEVVACGAAVRAALLLSGKADWGDTEAPPPTICRIIDVVPLTLGVGVCGDVMHVIIPRNTPIPDDMPLERTMSYRTVHDNQTLSRFVIYQGESHVASKNFRLGQLSITNLPPRPKGEVCVDVTFAFHPQDGILSVTAVVRGHFELRTSLTIEKPHTLSEDEVTRMQRVEQQYERSRIEKKQRDGALVELETLARNVLSGGAAGGGEVDPEIRPYAEQIVSWCEDNEWAMLPVITLQKEELSAKLGEGRKSN
eukprot:PhF_6_TR22559/c0_g1_i2/m.32092/K09490/HSPA5, BIP; heat shock 70kDa protein 5